MAGPEREPVGTVSYGTGRRKRDRRPPLRAVLITFPTNDPLHFRNEPESDFFCLGLYKNS